MISESWVLFSILCAVRLAAVRELPISDCDETYNFVEPLHYLLYGYGMETWEYSAQYGLRSYAYLWFYAVPAAIIKAMAHAIPVTWLEFVGIGILGLPVASEGLMVYFGTRSCIAVIGVMMEWFCVLSLPLLFSSAQSSERHAIALRRLAWFVLLFSTPISHASFSILPTSFCMEWYFVGVGCWIHAWKRGWPWWAVFGCIASVVVVGILGWPFALALALPMALHFACAAFSKALRTAVVVLFIVLSVVFVVDGVYYCVPWHCASCQIVLYNVLGGEGRGSHLYGVEPWHFFFRNLLVQYNVLCIVAAWFLVLVLRTVVTCIKGMKLPAPHSMNREILEVALIATPFYGWFAMWACVPHKEERFMVPAFSFLFVAVVGTLYVYWQGSNQKLTRGNTRNTTSHPTFTVSRLLVVAVLICFAVLSYGRNRAMIEYYGGPQRMLIAAASRLEAMSQEAPLPLRVCVGKEWYRFPSHFFLPHTPQMSSSPRAVFSFLNTTSFQGALPKMFVANGSCWLRPDMNDLNKPNEGQFVAQDEVATLCDVVWDTIDQGASGRSDQGWDSAVFSKNALPEAPEGTFRLLDVSATPSWCRVLNFPLWLSAGVYEKCAKYRMLVLRSRE